MASVALVVWELLPVKVEKMVMFCVFFKFFRDFHVYLQFLYVFLANNGHFHVNFYIYH